MREARLRESDQRMFDVQMMGGIVLHEGDVAEMKTGEGKTFVASLALYLNALPTSTTHDGRILGQGVHLVTVNDYLAQRDAEWNRGVYERLGVNVAFIETMMSFEERKLAYEADITYGTNSEFGFDYLRDNMAISLEGVVQRGHPYAIVDEVDSILIDEARTPLIISGEPTTAAKIYYDFARIVEDAQRRPVEGHEGRGRGARSTSTTTSSTRSTRPSRRPSRGSRRSSARSRSSNLYDPRNVQLVNHLSQALKAEALYKRDVDYVVAGRRGEDRRRVHRPHHGRPPLVGGPPPGGRGEGGRRRSRRSTRRSPRSRSRTTSASTRSSPA